MLGIYPPDEYSLYDTPVTTIVTIPIPGNTLLVAEDPTRMELLIGITAAGNNINVSTSQTSVSFGLLLSNNSPALQLSYIDQARLCQAAWFVAGTVGVRVFVVTVSLTRQPGMAGFPDAFRQRLPVGNGPQSLPDRPHRIRSAGVQRWPSALLPALRKRAPVVFGD